MKQFEQALRNFIGSINKLDDKTQFGIVGGFLILVFLFNKLKQYRRKNGVQQQQIRNMAALLVNRDRQKRDGIIWFLYLFVFTTLFTAFSYIIVYASFQYSFKPIIRFIDIFKINQTQFNTFLKVAFAIQVIICIALYKLVYYYDSLVSKQIIMTDSKVQEQNDKLKKEQQKQTEKQTDTSQCETQAHLSEKKNN